MTTYKILVTEGGVLHTVPHRFGKQLCPLGMATRNFDKIILMYILYMLDIHFGLFITVSFPIGLMKLPEYLTRILNTKKEIAPRTNKFLSECGGLTKEYPPGIW
jgi:hypothetical protein